MIRPSGLGLADAGCGLASRLAEQFPETSDAADKGRAIHEDIAAWITNGREPQTAEGQRLKGAWNVLDIKPEAEVVVEVRDPEDGALITKGTADIVWVQGDTLHVVDVKTGRRDKVEPATENPQINAYACGLALARGFDAYRAGLVFLGDGGVSWDWSDEVRDGALWAWLERIKRAASIPAVAKLGPHCGNCYQRRHCPSWLLPVDPVARELALVPLTRGDLATPEDIAEVDRVAKVLEDVAERAKAWVRLQVETRGPIRVGKRELALVESAGRRSVSVADVEAAGRGDLVRPGKPYTTLKWRKAG